MCTAPLPNTLPPMNPTDHIDIPTHVMARQVGDETVILDLASGAYFGLDPVGARAWELLAGNHSIGAACEVLLGEYEVGADQLERDISALLATLQSKQLISVRGG